MNKERILILLAGSAVLAAVVSYQLRTRRPATPVVATQNPAIVLPPAQSSPLQPSIPPAKLAIPGDGWGRNPFLTMEEIQKIHQPPPEVVVVPPGPAPAPALPKYEVSVIIMSEKGAWAVVSPGSRVIRVGDRLGAETVKQIKQESIVLERDGGTREVALKPPGLDVQPVPKG